MNRSGDHLDSHSAVGMPSPQASTIQAEKEKKRRAGQKEQSKKQCRQECENLDKGLDNDHVGAAETPAFELRNAGVKGFGLFATRDIEPGERIIQETPLFILPKKDTVNASIVESFMSLRSEQQAAYLNLSFHSTSSGQLKSETDRTSAAEYDAKRSTKVEDPETSVDGNRRSCASDMQPFPPKGLDSGSDIEASCKSPNLDRRSGDQSLRKLYELELPEYEATAPNPSVLDIGFDSPVRDDDSKDRIWNADDVEEAIGATTTVSNLGSEVIDSSDNSYHDQDADGFEMAESLAARIIDTWRTNSYMLDDGITLDYAGVGLTAARLNHSCVPNVYTAYNSTSGCITVQAVKPIAVGDELCTAYINGADKLRSERRAQLRMWGFECTCIACADGRDECRRREIKLLKNKVEDVKTQISEDFSGVTAARIEQTVVDLLDLATLMSDEGLLGPDLADVCFGAARCCLLVNRREEAGEFQSSGSSILLCGYGIDSPICSATLRAGELDEA